MSRPCLLLLAAALLAAPAAESATSCRTDRLGNTICRGAGPEPALRLPEPFALPAAPRPPEFIPGWREDSFGTIRPRRPAATGGDPFGEPPRPEPRTRCRSDSFGNVRCR